MEVHDIDLGMRFQRQPRVLGTVCEYAPRNTLLIPDGIKRGAHVFIIAYTQSKDDVYVTVADLKHWQSRRLGRHGSTQDAVFFKDYITKNVPPGEQIMVVWKDLVQ